MVKRFFDVSFAGLFCAAILVAGCGKHEPCNDMGPGDMTVVEQDMTTPPADMTACNPADPGCVQPDMAKPPVDMSNPPLDMITPPTDMAKPPVDMTMGGGDMSMGGGDMSMGGGDMSMGGGDMSMGGGDMSMGGGDMSMSGDMATRTDMGGTDGGMGMGGIGAPCTADTDCKAGPTPSCWKSNVLNNTANPPTAGGYCSAACTADADCGSGASCVNLGAGKFCLKSCSDATTCRHSGYACSFYGSAGICYPDSIYDCNPKTGTGTCTEAGTAKAGGCLRGAYEDKGLCSASCTVGAGTCADRGGRKRQCVYYDMTRDGYADTYAGLICVNTSAAPKATGAACTYLNECVDGAECDGIDGKCHQMCVKSGGMPACPGGTMCQDDLMTPMTGPGLCR